MRTAKLLELNNLPSQMRALLGLAFLVSLVNPALAWEPGDDWRGDQCEEVIDDANRVAEVCRGVFNGGELFLGVYWMDGAEVVGPCKATPIWPIEYRGLSKADAITWLEGYCGW